MVEGDLPETLSTQSIETISKDVAFVAFPNPFNPSTQIHFTMPIEGEVRLRIYNLQGQMVRELLHEQRSTGAHTVVWDGQDGANRAVASGVYFMRLETGKSVKISKLTLVK